MPSCDWISRLGWTWRSRLSARNTRKRSDEKDEIAAFGVQTDWVSAARRAVGTGNEDESTNVIKGLIGKKLGMTQRFADDGTVIPVTVIQAGPCVVVQRKTSARDGYEAVQLGLVEPGVRVRTTKPMSGHFKKAETAPLRVLREFPLAPGDEPKPGDSVKVSLFSVEERVKVRGISKGKGFAGVVKRHHFRGGAATHGSMFHRAPGSIGASSYPSRVLPGMRAAGHMGQDRVTVANIRVVEVVEEDNLLLVQGAVPGPSGSYLEILKA
jgi:large subunit ribosomal protein L3